MIIGVPTEIKQGENRVAITPAGTHQLVTEGHTVLLQSGAGQGSGMTDTEYQAAGAQLLDSAAEAWQRAEMILKVKEPLPAEYGYLREDLCLFTYLHLASDPELTEALLDSNITALGYETVQADDGSLPLLIPMSEVAGKLAVQIGAHYLAQHQGGRGVLLGGVPGVPPAEVVIVGCGTVGLNAAKTALGIGAQVTILDIDHDRFKYLDDIMHGTVVTVYSNPYNVARSTSYADLLIGSVLIPGALAPKIVTEQMVQNMKPGAVIIDVAVDQGGCVETIVPTSYAQPTYLKYDVVHYGVPNMPAAVPRTSTFALTNATLPHVRKIANRGLDQAISDDSALARGVNVAAGEISHPAVAAAFGEL